MRRYTTPTVELAVRGADLTGCECWVSITQGASRIETQAEPELDGEDTTLTVQLTQEQTGMLRQGSARVQVNWIDEGGHRNATTIREVEVDGNLLDRVVEYGED